MTAAKHPTRLLPIDEPVPHPDNPRRGNVDAIADSLATNGQYRPIVVSEATGHVLAGNHTLAAARQLGWTRIAATVVPDLTAEDERRILLADNRTADLAGYDPDALTALLDDLAGSDLGLTGTGWNPGDLEKQLAAAGSHVDPDGFDTFDAAHGDNTDYRCPRCRYEWAGDPKP